MPNNVVKAYAKETGKSVDHIDHWWKEAEEEASKKFKKKDSHYWAYVNGIVERRGKLKHGKLKKESMTFSEFLLNEENYVNEKTAEEAWALLNEHCKDALASMDKPIVRGMSTKFPSGLGTIQGDLGERRSANTFNYYTTILDATLPSEYPRRSKSIICANYKSAGHAGDYGKKYAIIPYDGVKIGVCPGEDMWDTEVTIGDQTKSIQSWNHLFFYIDPNNPGDKSFDSFIARVKKLIDMSSEKKKKTMWFDHLDRNKLKEEFAKAYSPEACGFKVATTKESHIYNDGKPHELWIGGKCVVIEMKIYRAMVKAHKDNLRK